MPTYLLLGGGGFIGSHLAEALLPHGRVVVYDLHSHKLDSIMSRITFVQGDVRTDHATVERLVQEADLVVNLIAQALPALYVSNPLEVCEIDLFECWTVAKMCIAHSKRLLQFSTCEVYGPALQRERFEEDSSLLICGPAHKSRWIYACSKQLLERLLFASADQLDFVIVRPFNWIGPRIDFLPSQQSGNPRVISHFIDALRTGQPIRLVDGGAQQRTFTYIDDAIEALLCIALDERKVSRHQVYNIGNPDTEISIRGLAELMQKLYCERWEKRTVEMTDVKGTDFYGAGYQDCDRRVPDISKMQRDFQWQPKHGLEAALIKCMQYYLQDS